MTPVRRLAPPAWLVLLLSAVAFLAVINRTRADRVERVTELAAQAPAVDEDSPTGYAGGMRRLIAPGGNKESYQWIAQTQQMLARQEWRVRHVDYDNAPAGRAVFSSSLYRWWLGSLALLHSAFTDDATGLAVERVALWADPALLGLLVVAGSIFIAWRFGTTAAAVFVIGAAAFYPFGGAFLPGCPDDVGLGLLLIIACALTLLAAVLPEAPTASAARGWLVASGVLGGVGLWLNVSATFPLLAALGIGAFAGERLFGGKSAPVPWRVWGGIGATTSLLAWLCEYAPSHLSLEAARLTENHPLYALAWWGGGELLAQGARQRNKPDEKPTRSRQALRLGAVVGLLALPVVMVVHGARGFLQPDAFAERLTALGEPGEASHFLSWLAAAPGAARVLAVVLPLGIGVLALFILCRPETEPARRRALVLTLMPVLTALGFSLGQIHWWNQVDATLLVLLVALLGKTPERPSRPLALGVAGLTFAAAVPGLVQLIPERDDAPQVAITARELRDLTERDLAQWLARRAGPEGVTALAPPMLTTSLWFHGGLRGVGSPYRENEEGFAAAVRLASATTADEALALAKQRRLTHIVFPSWDRFLDEYARLGTSQTDRTLMASLHAWLPPRWLRPVPYHLPAVEQLAEARVTVFEVVELQDAATALSRLSEYFLDMGNVHLASLSARSLAENHASDAGALVAKARADLARHDAAAVNQSLAAIAAALNEGADETLAWDRRVSLTLVLAEASRIAPARAQAQRCLDTMGELELRSLSERTLFRFLTLCRALGLPIDPKLKRIASDLLPAPMREKL